MSHRPPKNDVERLQNLIEALAEPGDDDDPLDALMHEELARRGLTLESWAAQMEAKAQAVIDRSRRARRVRAAKIAAAVAGGLCVAGAGGALALQATRGLKGGMDVQQSIGPVPPTMELDAGRGPPARR